jgi:cytochrome c oxidase cbb3-type subunit 1
METLVMRAGGWLVVALLAFFALAYSADAGFAVHMGIVMLAALITLVVTLRGADYGAIARGVLRVPADQSKYDDDPIRWGVIATVFWGLAGFLAGLYHRASASAACARCTPRR